ncbi:MULTISPECIES: HAD hydrolase-like protein [Streptococcus]|uniref:NLI interacting factor-like phosphatase n=1 Tax=Streptococcus infantis SK1076 TaxID=1005705 RepID=F5W1V1_9STRE|nr:HAD hydrolase-like protein [Streptococcus infantis]EGL85052.1 NLI interacting factor-like phosphatase [Streptococcus infantis SK1076]MCP9057227.1 HAD hydrolase-like protein [Streptococcus infantis]MCP9081523.1 HAD hydrolase-like protein [Streptococcus infantis]
MSSLSAIFFDLDGTLVDSSIGIHNGFTYTFDQLGVPSPDAKTIRGFMGPPLETSFASCLPAYQVETAIQLYRSYYKEKGVYEAQLFPQIKELLTELAKQYPLYITTTKNTPTAVDMTSYFGIDRFFDGIYGSSPQALHKADVIRQALTTHNLDPETVVIIGDTKFDMIGAQETGIKKLAVTWGFGDDKELMNFQPDWVAHQPTDILVQLQ